MSNIDRRHYADLYGPTTGDRIRLGDTNLVAEIESDATVYGDECKFGGGKVLRDGMGQAAGVLGLLAAACLLGGMVFFGVVMAPLVFTRLTAFVW